MKELLKANSCHLFCEDERATGFLISPRRILTVTHLLTPFDGRPLPEITAVFQCDGQGEAKYPVKLAERQAVLTVLELDQDFPAYRKLPFAKRDPEPGSPAFAFGFPSFAPGGFFADLTANNLHENKDRPREGNLLLDCDRRSADLEGMSGSALVIGDVVSGILLQEETVNGEAFLLHALAGHPFFCALRTLGFRPEFDPHLVGTAPGHGAARSAPPEFYHVGLPNRLFHGRSQEIMDILQKLSEDHLVFLSGPGGVGKSQIAKRIAHQHQSRYGSILWFSANTEEELLHEFRNAAFFYGLIEEGNDGPDDIISKLFGFIRKYSSALIVYDGADDISMDFLTETCSLSHTDTLVTTQNAAIDRDRFSVVPIGPFMPQEARSFLMDHSHHRRRTEQDANDCSDLCDLLENYPLTLEYGRSYVNENQISFAEYIQIYSGSKHRILKESIPGYHKTAYTAWKISYDKIIQRSAAAKDVLDTLSFLEPHRIPLQDIQAASSQYPPYEWHQAISIIKRYSLLTVSDGLADMHGLTQEFIRLQMRRDQAYQDAYQKTLRMLSSLMPDQIKDSQEKDRVNRILRHAMQLVSYSDSIHDEATLAFTASVASKSYMQGSYYQTIEFIESRLDRYGPPAQNFFLFQLITFLAQAYHYTGEDGRALDRLQKYEAIVSASDAVTEEQKYQLLARYKNIEGIIQKDQGDIPQCLAAFLQAMDLIESLPAGVDTEIRCNILMNTGIAYKHLDRNEKAIEYYRQAAAYAGGSKHLLLRIYGNMAEAYIALGWSDISFQYLTTCLDYASDLGDQRNKCISLRLLGAYYTDRKQYDKAAAYLRDSLNIADEIHFSIGIADVYCGLGNLAAAQGDDPEAGRCWKLALNISREIRYRSGIDAANSALTAAGTGH